jgi:leucyl-tRNA synthetase
LEELRYNTAIAAMMEYVNVLREATRLAAGAGEARVAPELIAPVIVMLAPLAPHFAEECWERLGHAESVFTARWPRWEEALAREEQVEVVVQVNGKLRSRLLVPRGLTEEQVVGRALADPAVRRFLDGKPIRKVVYVPDRLVNLVV